MFKARINDSLSSHVTVHGSHAVLVLDEVFANVDDIRRYAIEHAAQFTPPSKGSYPGVVLPVNFVDDCFQTLYRDIIGEFFLTVPAVKAKHRLGITCVPEDELSDVQSKPHRDVEQTNKFIKNLAAVTYLFDQPALGGTSFYSSVDIRSEPTSDLKLGRLEKGGLEKGGLETQTKNGKKGGRKYMTSSSDAYKLDGVSPAAYNRMIVFDSTQLHSGHINKPELLSTNIKEGRLTLNSFFSSITVSD